MDPIWRLIFTALSALHILDMIRRAPRALDLLPRDAKLDLLPDPREAPPQNYVIMRHNSIRDLFAELLSEICKDVV